MVLVGAGRTNYLACCSIRAFYYGQSNDRNRLGDVQGWKSYQQCGKLN